MTNTTDEIEITPPSSDSPEPLKDIPVTNTTPIDPAVPDELREQLDHTISLYSNNPRENLVDDILTLFTQYARQERLDELENLASDKHSDWTSEILANRIAQLTATPHEGEELGARLVDMPPRKWADWPKGDDE